MHIQGDDSEMRVRVARRQLLWLAIAHFAQTAAIACLLFSTVGDAYYALRKNPFGMLWVYLFIPIPFFTPWIAAALQRWNLRTVLIGCGIANFALVAAFAPSFPLRGYDGIWYLALPFFALVAVAFSTALDVWLTSVANDARLPLGRAVSLLLLVSVAGTILGFLFEEVSRDYQHFAPRFFAGSVDRILTRLTDYMREIRIDPIVMLLGTLYVIVLATADHARASVQVHRWKTWQHALQCFFSDCVALLKQLPARAALSSRALTWGFLGVGGFFFLSSFSRLLLISTGSAIAIGIALGCGLALLQRNSRRLLGWLPIAATGVVIAYWLARNVWNAAPPLVAMGALCALLIISVASAYLRLLEPGQRVSGAALGQGSAFLLGGLIAVGYLRLTAALPPHWAFWVAPGLLLCGAALAWKSYFREALEWLVEILIWPMYRIRAVGPGRDAIPQSGPLLIIADHTSWFDPIWIAKVTPRRVRPMMTSRFYDLRGLRWLMIHVVGAIRVQLSAYRREAPELDQAIGLLDRGECVLMFPEGRMRRTAERPLRNFGQGVWHILSQRPATPVVVCWIEGGWGSYFSYAGGPPTKNKRFDFWRPIHIGVEAPQILDPELLKDQRATRRHVMQLCLDARRYLGLEPIAKVDSVQDEVEVAADANDSD